MKTKLRKLGAGLMVLALTFAGVGAHGATVQVANQTELNDAVKTAAAGDVIEITKADTYKVPSPTSAIKIVGVDGVVFNAIDTNYGQSVGQATGTEFENVKFAFGTSLYTGFQHSSYVAFAKCSFTGRFNSYGEMHFTECSFEAPSGDYSMWLYAGDTYFKDCTFSGNGKFFNIYNEGNDGGTPWKVEFDGCTFSSTKKNKAALNVKSTCGSRGLKYDVTVSNCKIDSNGNNFPSASMSDSLIVFNGLIQLDDINASVPNGITITQDGKVLYADNAVAGPEVVIKSPTQEEVVENAETKGEVSAEQKAAKADAVVSVIAKAAEEETLEVGNSGLSAAGKTADGKLADPLVTALKAAADEGKKAEITNETKVKKTIDVVFKGMTVEAGENVTTTKIAYDVTPKALATLADGTEVKAAIPNGTFGKINFRMPLTADFTGRWLKVSRTDDGSTYTVVGLYQAQKEGDVDFVQVDGDHFTTYVNEITDETPVASIGGKGYMTLQAALSAAQAAATPEGKVITVVGTATGCNFNGDNTGITLVGAEGHVITGDFGADGSAILKNVTFRNLKFVGGKITFSTNVDDYENFTIEGCTFDGTDAGTTNPSAITLNRNGTVNADGIRIRNNTISNYYLGGSASGIVIGNSATKAHGVEVVGNTIENVGFNAVQLLGCDGLTLTGNTVNNVLSWAVFNVGNSTNIRIDGNVVKLIKSSKYASYPSQSLIGNANGFIVLGPDNRIATVAGETLADPVAIVQNDMVAVGDPYYNDQVVFVADTTAFDAQGKVVGGPIIASVANVNSRVGEGLDVSFLSGATLTGLVYCKDVAGKVVELAAGNVTGTIIVPEDRTFTIKGDVTFTTGAKIYIPLVQDGEEFTDWKTANVPSGQENNVTVYGYVAQVTVDEVTTKFYTLEDAVAAVGDGDVTIAILGDKSKLTPPKGWEFKQVGEAWTLVRSPVARIDEATYPSLQKAVDAAEDGDVIVIVADINYDYPTGPVVKNGDYSTNDPRGKTLTLDLNGHAIAAKIDSTFTSHTNLRDLIFNAGDMTVMDSVGTGSITISESNDTGWANSCSIFGNSGKMTILSGAFANNGAESMSYVVDSRCDWSARPATLDIQGGTFECPKYTVVRALTQFVSGSENVSSAVAVSGGTFTGKRCFYVFYGSAGVSGPVNVEISGGSFTAANRVFHMDLSGLADDPATIGISGGSFTCADVAGNSIFHVDTVYGEVQAGGGVTVAVTDGRFACGQGVVFESPAGKESTLAAEASGGIYSAQFDARHVAAGYILVPNTDAATKAAYPWTIGPQQLQPKTDGAEVDAKQEAKDAIPEEKQSQIPTAVETVKTDVAQAATSKQVTQFTGTGLSEAVVNPDGSLDSRVVEALKAGVTDEDAKQKIEQLSSDSNSTKRIEIELKKVDVGLSVADEAVVGSANEVSYKVEPRVKTVIEVKNEQGEVTDTIESDAKVPNETIANSPITFRLGVTWAVGEQVKVLRDDENFGITYVKGEGDERYVELTSNHFSSFKLMRVNVPTVCEVGGQAFESVSDAIAASAESPTAVIKLTAPCGETGLPLLWGQEIDLNGYEFTGSIMPVAEPESGFAADQYEQVKTPAGRVFSAPKQVAVPLDASEDSATIKVRIAGKTADDLKVVQTSGRALWQDLAMGSTEKLIPQVLRSAIGSKTITIRGNITDEAVEAAAKVRDGVSVKYQLMKKVGSGAYAQFGEIQPTPVFTVEADELEVQTFWKIQTVFDEEY